jgi:hypothetical protein
VETESELRAQIEALKARLDALQAQADRQQAEIEMLRARIGSMPQHDPFKPIGPGPNQWPVYPQRDRIIYTSPNTAPPRIEIKAETARSDA